MQKVLKSILDARKIISETKVKKAGRNTYSKYDYFTPDQVSKLVQDACDKTGLVPMFSLERNETGYEGVLRIFHAESGDMVSTVMSTDMPEIKATNNAQKLGGAMTYTERYMKMSAFGIVDNNLDFDNDQQPEKKTVAPKPTPTQPKKETQTKEDVFVGLAKKEGGMSVKLANIVNKAITEYKWSSEKVIKLLAKSGITDQTEESINEVVNG